VADRGRRRAANHGARHSAKRGTRLAVDTFKGGGINVEPVPESMFVMRAAQRKAARLLGPRGDPIFKIRNCMNIAAAGDSLPLFDSADRPRHAGQAAARTGVELSDVSGQYLAPNADLSVTAILSQKATELCARGQSARRRPFGRAGKKGRRGDCRSTSRRTCGRPYRRPDRCAIRGSKEAKESLEGLTRQQGVVPLRRNYYRDSKFLNPGGERRRPRARLQAALI